MATWQFSVVLIPESWAKENHYNPSSLYDEEGYYDTEVAWANRQPKLEFKSVLSEILPLTESWNSDLLVWGNAEEHDIQVFIENEKIEGINIRLDLSKNINDIIIKIINAARVLNCSLFFPELKLLVETNEFNLKSAIDNCNAGKFVNDPQEFLTLISKKT